MKIPPTFDYLFEWPGAKRWLARSNQPKPNALLPLTYQDRVRQHAMRSDQFAYADDPRVLNLTERLAMRLTEEFPQDKLSSGFAGSSAVPGDFYSVLSVSGYGADPLPLPLMDNTEFIKSLGLVSDIRPADVPWLKELIRLFFGHVAPADLHIRKKASTSFLYFTTDNQYKKLATLKCLKNCDEYLSLLSGKRADMVKALDDYHSILISALHRRQQPTKVMKSEDGSFKAKERMAPTEQEARTGSVKASITSDFSVRDNAGNVISNHFAMRQRTVWGMCGIPNYFMTAIMGCVRAVYANRFSFTYKTKGWQDKEERIAKYKYVVGSDVKNMDTTLPRWFFDFLLNELTNYWDERLVKVLERMFRASYVAAPPWRDTPADYNPVFGPDPLDGHAEINAGLSSGIFINPDVGKLWMTFVYLMLYKDLGALISPADIEPFLQGKNHDHALLDMSDDATLMTNSPIVRDGLMRAKSPYAVLEPETPVIFLGDVFAMEGNRKRAYPNPITYIVNSLAREDSIDRIDPISYSEGVLARHQQYARTPIFRDLNRIYEEEVRSALGVNPYLIARTVARRQRFEEIDALVIANPHYLHYRVDPKEVSPEVLDEIVATIPASDFFNDIRHLFKVPTVELSDITEV
jgi:hypothetical protein